jgi:DNA-binding response OmpR family regulator
MSGSATLLGVLPVNGGSSHMAIVGYLLPAPAARLRLPAMSASHEAQGNGADRGALQGDRLIVDATQRRVLVSGRDAGLVFKEFELFAFLAANPDRVFTRAHLLASVWGDTYDGTSRTVDVHMHRLRRKLGPQYAWRLVTMRRVGYLYRPSRPGSRVASGC